jgi:hypothetical protein
MEALVYAAALLQERRTFDPFRGRRDQLQVRYRVPALSRRSLMGWFVVQLSD